MTEQPTVTQQKDEAAVYAREAREIAGMLAQAPDGPLRWKQYRLGAIADFLSSIAWNTRATLSPSIEEGEVERVFAEGLVQQAERFKVFPRPNDADTPGRWRDRVRKAAILATLTPQHKDEVDV